MTNVQPIFKSNYFYLLISLLAYLLIAPLLVANDFSDYLISVLFTLIIILCVMVISRKKKFIAASFILGAISLVTYWRIILHGPSEFVNASHYVSYIIFLILMTYYVTSSIAHHTRITQETLLGAISGYLFLGLTWAYIFLLLNAINPQSFSDHTHATSIRDLIQHFIYFSFESLTTLGFGDILPLTDIARTFTWLEAATGQIYLAVWISQLVGLRIAQMVRSELN